MAIIDKIKLSGQTFEIQDSNASKTVELTQSEYDSLSTKDPNTYYIITDATPIDITNYYTKTDTDDLLDDKADTATTYTKSETNTLLAAKANTATTYTKSEVDTALGGKQATLVSSQNIKTINNQSILGSGNIDIQGGSVDVDSALSPTSENPVQNKVIYNKIDEVEEVTAAALNELDETVSGKQDELISGTNIKTINNESILGSGNIVIGGTVDPSLDPTSTNPVQNKVIYNKIDEVEQVTAAGLNALNDKFGGLKLQQITQSAYDQLQTKDPSTLYVIVD